MAIAFDAASNSGYKTSLDTIPYSWNHTCSGSDRYLLVGIAMLAATGCSVTTVTYNSVSLTRLKSETSASGDVKVELWGLLAPATGLHSVQVDISGTPDSISCAASYTGVNTAVAYESVSGAHSTGSEVPDDPASVVVATVADNDWVVDIIASEDTTLSVGAGQTSRNNVGGALGSGAMSDEGPKTPAGNVTMSWNQNGLPDWAIAAVALRPNAPRVWEIAITASDGNAAGRIWEIGPPLS